MPDLIATLSYTDAVGKGCAHGEYVGWPDLETSENANQGRKLRDVRADHVCQVFDGRRAKDENEMERLKFKHAGFELVDDEHLESYFRDMVRPLEIDFKDEDQVIRDYVPWVEAMVRSKISEYLEDIFTTTNNDEPLAQIQSRDPDAGEPGQNHPEVRGVWVWDLAYRSSLLKNELQESNAAAIGSSEKKEIDKLAPVPLVHADYFDDKGVRKRLRSLLEKRGDTLAPLGLPLRASGTKDLTEEQIIREYCDGDGIVLGVNVWRSTDPDHPVKRNPLGLLPIEHWGGNRAQRMFLQRFGDDYRAKDKVVSFELNCPDVIHEEAQIFLEKFKEYKDASCWFHEGRTEEQMISQRTRDHHWVYFSDMLPMESLLFFTHDPRNSYDKKYHSEDRRSNGVFHTSLRDCIEYDADVPIDESEAIQEARFPPRQSIEARVFVFLKFGKNQGGR